MQSGATLIAKSVKEAAALVGSKRVHNSADGQGMIAKKKKKNFNLDDILEECQQEEEEDGLLMKKRHKKGDEKEIMKASKSAKVWQL